MRPHFSMLYRPSVSISVFERSFLYFVLIISMAGLGYRAATAQESLNVLKAERSSLCKSLLPDGCVSNDDARQLHIRISPVVRRGSVDRRQRHFRQRLKQRFDERLRQKMVHRTASKSGNTAVAVNEQDSLALVALYQALDGPSWPNNSQWLTGPVATWFGVGVDDAGRVTSLELSGNELFGFVPAEIGMLTALELIDLGDNFLLGQLPIEVWQLTNLQIFDFSYNFLSGEIPADVGNMTNLVELVLWGNSFSGEIPAVIGSLSWLEVLSIEFNALTGPIPPELGQLIHLRELYLDNNMLTGEIPSELGMLSNLISLILGNNDLEGALPSTLTDIGGLLALSVANAGLSGTIPDLSPLEQLASLDLGGNNYEGPFPEHLLDLFTLVSLYLNDNAFSGEIPASLGAALFKMVDLDLAYNQFEGALPQSLAVMDQLRFLDVSFNQLAGPLSTLNANQRMRFLYLNNNQFTGTITDQYSQLLLLIELDLSGNDLEGEIPVALGDYPFIQFLSLGRNALTGSIPDELTALETLKVLDLWQNDLTGPIPPDISNMKALQLIDFGSNTLSGELPVGLSELRSLKVLYLDGNAFSGAVRESYADLDSLFVLSLGDNELTFVPDLSGMPFLDTLSIGDNWLTFDSIEPNIVAANGNVSYAPQARVPVIADELETTLRYAVEVGGSANVYQWFRAGLPIPDATQPVYETEYANLTTADQLVLEVTNEIVTDLTIESEPVRADARLAGTQISPEMPTVMAGDSLQFVYQGFDQFDAVRYFSGAWSATGGAISDSGLFVAGDVSGTFSVEVADALGNSVGSTPVIVEGGDDPVGVEDSAKPARRLALHTNYPNPFRSATQIAFELPAAMHVSLRVFDLLGRELDRVVDGPLEAGLHRIAIDASSWPAGLYLYTLHTDGFEQTRAMVKVQ